MPPGPTGVLRYVWGGALALLAGLLVGVWDVSLLWRFRDTPEVLGGLLAAVFATVVLLQRLALAVPADARTRSMRSAARLDGIGLVFVAYLLLLLLLFHVGFERAAADGRSYFIQVRSLVMDWDLDFANDEEVFGGHGVSQYAFGAPLLWTPFFVLGHVWVSGLSLIDGSLRPDGYYYPYQRAIGLATLLYGFAGLVLVYRALRLYVSRAIAAVSTIGFSSTSFLVWYLTVENSMVHGVSMFATTLFLFLWLRFRASMLRSTPADSGRPALARWAWLGAAAGLMAIVRWQNAVFVLLPVADLLWLSWAGRTDDTGGRVRAVGRSLATFGAAALAAFSPQFVFWQVVYGSWLHVPAQEHAFEPSVLPPYLIDVLFSPNRGLFTWSPVVLFALVGLACFGWRHRRVALVLAGGFLGQLWVNAAVETWWGGASFGARRFSNSALVFAMGLAGLLTAFERRPLLAPALGLTALLGFNTALALGYREGSLQTGGVSFDRIVQSFHERFGNPFSFPVGLYTSWKYDVGLDTYDDLGRTYSNITIDLGAADDDTFLGRGWSGRETGGGLTFRWADADASSVIAPLVTNADDYVAELEWAPFGAPGLPEQRVDVEVNGVTVASVTLRPGMNVDRIAIPSSALRVNLNVLQFRYAYAASPRELGLSDDPRTLAVQVATIRLLRQLRY